MCACVRVLLCVFSCVHVCVCVKGHVRACVHECVCMRARARMCVCVFVCVRVSLVSGRFEPSLEWRHVDDVTTVQF